MEGKPDQIKWVYWDEYAPANANAYSPWAKQKSEMICKCAKSVLCREAFGLSGLYGEEEMSSTIEMPVDSTKDAEIIDPLQNQIELCLFTSDLQLLADSVKKS